MLSLPDIFHAFVVLHRFRHRGRSRVTDVVVAETARIAMNTQIEKFKEIALDQKERMCAGERERKETRIVALVSNFLYLFGFGNSGTKVPNA